MGQRSNRRNRQRVDLGMAPSIMILDVLKLRRVLERRLGPVQVAHPLVNRRIP